MNFMNLVLHQDGLLVEGVLRDLLHRLRVQCCLIWKRTHQFSSLTGLNLTAVDVRRLVRVTALLDELVLQITIDATEPCDLSLLLQRLNLGLELLGLRS